MAKNSYESPFSSRYSSPEMQYLFSPDMKFTTWRKLWIALAEAEKNEGLGITDEQISEMKEHVNDIDYDKVAEYEKTIRHDVMSHIKAYGDQCPKARPIIHLGATSCYVGDNTDIIIMREALGLVKGKILKVLSNLRDFSDKYKSLPALAYTHLQPAQLTTVGKRATLWMYDLMLDIDDLEYVSGSLKLLGSKGTTGTQASFLELFNGDMEKIQRVEDYIADKFGFAGTVPVSGQTYTRKFDSRVLNVVSGIAQSAYKFSGDLRLLQSFGEIEEPFEKNQVGSSAMPYKRNPMRCERIAALSRFIITDSLNPALTESTQMFERTLDDSANRRLSIAEAFLAIDGVLNIYINVTENLVVYPKVINARIMANLPYMASENIMMDAVKKGGDRQDLHERIREYSHASAKKVKEEGLKPDLIDRIVADPMFKMSREEIEAHLKPENYIGCSVSQVEGFLKKVDVVLKKDSKEVVDGSELKV